MAEIGSTEVPVFIDENGVPKACDLPIAKDTVKGMIKTGYTKPENEKKYPVKTDSNGNAYVEVPWEGSTVKMFSVTFKDEVDEDVIIAKVNVIQGFDATPPIPPDHDGMGFIGWEGNYKNVQKDEVVVAKYRELVIARFYNTYDKTNLADEVKCSPGDTPVPPIAGLNGWTFVKWSDYEGNDVGPITENTEYYAHWRRDYAFEMELPSADSGEKTIDIVGVSIPSAGYGLSSNINGWIHHDATPSHSIFIEVSMSGLAQNISLGNLGPIVDEMGDGKSEFPFSAVGTTVTPLQSTDISKITLHGRKTTGCTVTWGVRGAVTIYLGDPKESKGYDWVNLDVSKLNVGDKIMAPSAYGFANILLEVVDKDNVTVTGKSHTVTLQTKYTLTTNDEKQFTKKFDSGNKQIWKNSELRTWLNGEFLNAFLLKADGKEKTGYELEQAQAFINAIQKPNLVTYTAASTPETTADDKVWIPSVAQVGGGKPSYSWGIENSCLAAFTGIDGTGSNRKRVKLTTFGTAQIWWLRSAYSYNSARVWRVDTGGSLYDGYASGYGVAPLITIAW